MSAGGRGRGAEGRTHRTRENPRERAPPGTGRGMRRAAGGGGGGSEQSETEPHMGLRRVRTWGGSKKDPKCWYSMSLKNKRTMIMKEKKYYKLKL